MKPFTKKELLIVISILATVFLITLKDLGISVRRSRDAQRRADLGSISDALIAYFADFSYFPPSESGRIKACPAENFDFENLRACEWGEDSLKDITDLAYPPYLSRIQSDPKKSEGVSYLYFSNTQRYQIYAYLEGGIDESGFNEGIVARNLACGSRTCNFGKSSGDTPLDISIDEYERQLFDKRGSGSAR